MVPSTSSPSRPVVPRLPSLRGALLLACCATLPPGCGGPEPVAEAPASLARADELYVASTLLWTSTSIPVCWENPTAANQTERGWVRTSAKSTWDAQSAVNFVGWDTCTATSRGIRIRIADEQPRTLGLGRQLDGMSGGMVLNFTFQNWSTSCQGQRESCIRKLAVHEFGHALGFSHEHNRPDTPSSCTEEPQGQNGDLMIGAWDLASVMNYCNPKWNGDGQLSTTDIQGVQSVYGKSHDVGVIPQTETCPAGSELISIGMDDEDGNNANWRTGWLGATVSDINTRFVVCRTSGDAFKPLATTSIPTKHYATLKLGQECPSGSTEVRRFFDNQDGATANSKAASDSFPPAIEPNVSDQNTTLYFCLFTSGPQTMSGFPSLGMSYGVFAPGDFELALARGALGTDDEDTNNTNSYSVPAGLYSAATRIVSDGRNTTLNLARVQ